MRTVVCFIIMIFCLGLGATASAGTDSVLAPKLILETPDNPIRDIAVASDGTIFTFDYAEYRIKKFDRTGRFLLEFGGTGKNDGQFTHLTGLRAIGDKLVAVDSVGVSTFDLNGRLIGKTVFAEEVTPNFSVALEDGRFVGFQVVASELKAVLTFRSPQGRELDRLASHDLKEFFPELKTGEDFFLSDEYARNYLYTLDSDGNFLWAATDAPRVHRYRDGRSRIILSENLTPLPFPENERIRLSERKAKIAPPLHLHVPAHLPLLRHLAVDAGGDLWLYIQSREKSGFWRYSKDGQVKGPAAFSGGFDVTKAQVRIFGERMFFIVGKTLSAADLQR
jgi:hypothetical protein